MGLDKETQLGFLSISLDGTKEHIAVMKKNADSDGFNDDKEKPVQLNICSVDGYNLSTEEYYFDDSDNEIHFSGEFVGTAGKGYVSFSLPLSDIVLIDILQHSIKKLNKLKVALESLK